MNEAVFLNKNKIIFFGHHKSGSYWISLFLIQLCQKFNKKFHVIYNSESKNLLQYETDVLIDCNSTSIIESSDIKFKAVHLIRDPRDIIVSGMFYHKWTDEEWVNISNEKYGMSYKEKINSLSNDEALFFEMDECANFTIKNIKNWNYNNPNILEIRYEDLIVDTYNIFYKIFNHIGINPIYYPICYEIVYNTSIFKTGRNYGEIENESHIRSGKIGQWKTYFSSEHKKYFLNKFDDILIQLGYEKDNSWINT